MLRFLAHLSDGSVIAQTPEDASTTTPGKNAFFDVLERINDVQRFDVSDGTTTYTVDLTDGTFAVNGQRFNVGKPFKPSTPYRLIYYARKEITVSRGTATDSKTLYVCIGWQVTQDGKNIQRTITV